MLKKIPLLKKKRETERDRVVTIVPQTRLKLFSIGNGGLVHAKTIMTLLKKNNYSFQELAKGPSQKKKKKNQTFESFIDSEFQIKQIFFCLIYSGKK